MLYLLDRIITCCGQGQSAAVVLCAVGQLDWQVVQRVSGSQELLRRTQTNTWLS